MSDELQEIKKIYGEDMAHLCRDSFPTLLDRKGYLLSILKKLFAPTHSLYKDLREKECIKDFVNFISNINEEDKKRLIVVKDSPEVLMSKVGYNLFECKTEEDIQSYRKYYAKGEEICTFNGGRLNRNYVFFAVKKNVDEIKRENFKNPRRQDTYGTSVISIQFSRDEYNTLSIKNRYNDTVGNPDATFFNNLDNIIPGLTKSFEKYYNLNINYVKRNDGDFLKKKMNYIQANDSKFYRYNVIIDNYVFCENNIYLLDGEPKLDFFNNKERYILMDNYLVDRQEKKITLFNGESDSFTKSINDVGEIRNIDLFRNRDNRLIVINYMDGKSVSIRIDEYNSIIEYENNYVKKIENDFLKYNKSILRLSLPLVEVIGDNFLFSNNRIKELMILSTKHIGGNFLYYNNSLENLDIRDVETIDYSFMFTNNTLINLIISNIREIGNNFLYSNKSLKDINIPDDTIMGLHCLFNNSNYAELIDNDHRRLI